MKKLLALLFLSMPCFATNPIIGYVQLSTGPQQSGGFNTSTGTTGVLTVLTSATVSGAFTAPTQIGMDNPGAFSPAALFQLGPGVNRQTYLSVNHDTAPVSGNGHGIGDYSSWNGAQGTAYASIETQAQTVGFQNFDHIGGFQSAAAHTSTGTLNALYQYYAVLGNTLGGVIGNYYAFYAAELGGSNINNEYGMYIEPLTTGTKKFPIYSSDPVNPVVFQGPVRISSATAAGILAKTPLFGEGEMWECHDCTLARMCISTGTGLGAYVPVSSPTVKCQ